MDLETNIKEYLNSVDLDFDLPYLENYFQIYNEVLIIYELNSEICDEFTESQKCLVYYILLILLVRNHTLLNHILLVDLAFASNNVEVLI